MRDLVIMVVSLTIITTVCGAALGGLNMLTEERIKEQTLVNKQIPAVEKIFVEASNDFLQDRRGFEEDEDRVFFPAREKGGDVSGVAFETFGKGFAADVGVMVGFDLTKNTIAGVAVTTHEETPGVGARAADEPAFGEQFRGMPLESAFRVRQDGGEVDAITGATVTSRAVCDAVSEAVTYFQQRSEEIEALLEQPQGGGK